MFLRLLILPLAVWLVAGNQTRGQSSFLAASAAKIGLELSLLQNASLHFGTMSRPTGNVNIVLSTYNVRTATAPTLITLLSQAPLSQNASYTVNGSKNAHYLVITPANNTVVITSGANQMHVDDFVVRTMSNGIGNSTGKLNLLGTDNFFIGATLKLLSGQPSGVYSGTFNISVAYN